MRRQTEVATAIRRVDRHGNATGGRIEGRPAAVIVVVRQQVPAENHAHAIRVASQDPETPKPSAVREPKRREDPVAGQEEILAEAYRQTSGTQRLGLHEGNREESLIATRLELQARR